MDKRPLPCWLWPTLLLLAGIGLGMMLQAKVQHLALEKTAEDVSMVRDLVRASSECAAALTSTTAERNRLLEHLADVESSAMGSDCIPVMVWACPVKDAR